MKYIIIYIVAIIVALYIFTVGLIEDNSYKVWGSFLIAMFLAYPLAISIYKYRNK